MNSYKFPSAGTTMYSLTYGIDLVKEMEDFPVLYIFHTRHFAKQMAIQFYRFCRLIYPFTVLETPRFDRFDRFATCKVIVNGHAIFYFSCCSDIEDSHYSHTPMRDIIIDHAVFELGIW